MKKNTRERGRQKTMHFLIVLKVRGSNFFFDSIAREVTNKNEDKETRRALNHVLLVVIKGYISFVVNCKDKQKEVLHVFLHSHR